LPDQPSDSQELDIEFRNVTKRFEDVIAVDDVSLSVERGAFFSFLGPSGCGKTTSLRLIAGFDQPTEGDVFISGKSVVGIPSHKRPVNMVFQQYALFPHMDVTENIGYGLRQRNPKPAKQEIAKRVDATLEMVRLSGYGKRRVWELSGGQQQRVALARALINHPTCLLLDEPLAALDRKLRREMQIELQTLQREVGITFILVTHDQEEALSMSDRLAVFREGRIDQVDSPQAVYDSPRTEFVAGFVGSANVLTGEQAGFLGMRPVNIALRPEKIHLHTGEGVPQDNSIQCQGRLIASQFLGINTRFEVEVSEGLVLDVVLQNTRQQKLPGVLQDDVQNQPF